MPEVSDTHEFDDIVAALREERPRIDAGYARELDNRAAAGFPRRRRPRLPKLPRLMVPGVAVGAVAALVITAGVLSSGGGSTDSSGSSSGASSTVLQAPKDSGSGGSAASKPRELSPAAEDLSSAQKLSDPAGRDALRSAPPASPPVGGARNRVQEQTASMTLTADASDVADVGDKILGVTDQVGGFVVSSTVRATDGESGGGDFQLRVPTARLDDALARLSRLAHVSERQQGVQDITSLRNVARDRLRSAKAERRSLLKRLAGADTDNETASLKARLRDVSASIGAARGDLARVKRRASFAAVAVTLGAKSQGGGVPAPDDGKWTPADALRDAGRVLEVVAGVAVILLAVLGPIALLAGAGVGARRLAGRRGRAQVLDTV